MFVITGGSVGIGKALALALAAREERVLIVGRSASTLQAVADSSPLITSLVADVSSMDGRAALIDYLRPEPSLRGFIHNAGIISPIAPALDLEESDWHHLMAVNLDAPLLLTQALQAQLAGGRVLHIGSGAAYIAIKGWTAYCVSKAALSMLTRCLQLESTTISFANVMPGIVDTHMQAEIRQADYMDEDKRQFFRQLKQDHHLIKPETLALFLTWLLLDIDKAQYVSQEWDIYDTSHHVAWLKAPHRVPALD